MGIKRKPLSRQEEKKGEELLGNANNKSTTQSKSIIRGLIDAAFRFLQAGPNPTLMAANNLWSTTLD